jgi:hypothetical protein
MGYLNNQVQKLEEAKTTMQKTQSRTKLKQSDNFISKEFVSTIKMKPYKTSTLVFKDEKGMTI